MEEFIRQLETEFDGLEAGTLTAETRFRELEQWSSLQALLVMAHIDATYGVTISPEEMRAAQTVEDLFRLTEKLKKNT